ncbi:hypothetical protein CLOM621_04930 [Clostridium sp. M62/1]|nr:hypothetical protein CLOM621_04930 [Clostridium sp. M62/1]
MQANLCSTGKCTGWRVHINTPISKNMSIFFAEFATLCESLSAIFKNIIAFGWAKININ